MVKTIPASPSQPYTQRVVFRNVPLEFETIARFWIVDSGQTFGYRPCKDFFAIAFGIRAFQRINPGSAIQQCPCGNRHLELIPCLQLQQWMHCPQIKLLSGAAVRQLVIKPNVIFLQLNSPLEMKGRYLQVDTGAQDAAFPSLRVHRPGSRPNLTMIGEMPPLPVTSSNGRQALVHADERTAGEVISGLIPKKLPFTGRMPKPFA